MSESPDSPTNPQYPWPKILAVTLIPGALMVLIGVLLPIVGGLHEANLLGVYYFSEAAILAALMYWFTGREKSRAINDVLPYQKPTAWPIFIAALVAVTVYAIFFRDFFTWPSLNSMAMNLMEAMPWWPPSSGLYPGRVGQYAAEGAAGIIAHSLFILIAVGSASAMQTIYFRGFLLPRMDRFGLMAVVYNSLLFVVFHLASPYFWAHFLIFTVMWGVVTYYTRNMWIAVLSHVIFNSYTYVWIILIEIDLLPDI